MGCMGSFLLFIVKKLEDLCIRCTPFGRIYEALFYGRLIKKEKEVAGLKPTMRVLHVGSGRLPVTAVALAKRGMQVDALDNDPKAVEGSRKFLDKAGYGDKVRVILGEGCEMDCSVYDAVFVSLHVIPRDKVIKECLESLSSTGRLLYRNPKGPLRMLYPRVNPAELGPYSYMEIPNAQGKETVIIFKEERESVSCRGVSLDTMKVGAKGMILSACDVPQAPSFSIRPGKHLTLQAREPFGGAFVVWIDHRVVAIPRDLAFKIRVSEVACFETDYLSPR